MTSATSGATSRQPSDPQQPLLRRPEESKGSNAQERAAAIAAATMGRGTERKTAGAPPAEVRARFVAVSGPALPEPHGPYQAPQYNRPAPTNANPAAGRPVVSYGTGGPSAALGDPFPAPPAFEAPKRVATGHDGRRAK